jgi:uncharacterized MAPEG superfamily protein
MPALPSVSDVLKVQLLWTDGADSDVYNVMYFRYSGGAPSGADAATLAQAIWNAGGFFDTVMSTDTSLTGVIVTDLSSPSSAQGEYTGNLVGTRTGGHLSGGTAVVVGYQIARRYRGGKPRNYFPFLTSADLQTRQLWATAAIGNVRDQFSSFIGAVLGATGGSTTITAHVNVSYYQGSRVVTSPTTGRARNVPILRAAPQVDTINSFLVRPIPGSQRRRNK